MANQLSGMHPKALESRSAISELILLGGVGVTLRELVGLYAAIAH